jgi:hypothetical protein
MDRWVELFGLSASAIVAVSMTMRNIKRLRIVNLIGSVAFASYGFMIGAWPVVLLNAFIILVNAYHLRRLISRKDAFELLFTDIAADEYAARFLRHYGSDLKKFFPSFDFSRIPEQFKGTEACFILRETVPVSLVVFERRSQGEVAILLDYAVPAYRDLKSARFLFDALAKTIEGARVFTASAEVESHRSYLASLGFREAGRNGTALHYRKEI